ncbi:methyl-accepting chemotaxis protein [Solibacillus sp. MA9]|uniref:Methyl-accepting chemotaxis protein n=1 Tax=Solibacillus palustris TaxID=2908203 RepID=A0ABS9UF25_9BACL|nr:methyl-accepting chemotaxis protein [Solibacillus sp. MA9]
MRKKTMRTRLTFLLLAVCILPVLVTVVVNYFATTSSFESIQNEDQKQMEHIVNTQVETEKAQLQAIATSLAKNPEVAAILQSTNRTSINESMKALFTKLQHEQQLAVLEIGDAQGMVHVRGHNLEQFGDDKSKTSAIQETLNGNVISGLEYGKSGLAIRAFAPIEVNGTIIGTVQVGVNDQFIQLIQELLPLVQLQFLNPEELETFLAKSEDVSLKELLNGDATRVFKEDAQVIESYLPFLDPTGKEVIGVMLLKQDVSAMQSIQSGMFTTGIIVLVLAFFVAIVIATVYSKSLTAPVAKTASALQRLRDGDLTQTIELTNRQDEMGMMMQDMKDMQQQLHSTIKEVALASETVSAQSILLKEDVSIASSSSQAITQVMEDISSGAERQTFAITEVSETVNDFSNRLQETVQQSTILQNSSQSVRVLSVKGAQLMHASSAQMNELQMVMNDAVTKMAALDIQASKITTFVSIIEEVANQTNLLALNASIEAARAGEHGKGFAVVAEEVRKLAVQVEQSVSEITSIVSTIQRDSTNVSGSLQNGYTQVELGVSQLATTSQTFNEIEQAVATITEAIAEMMQGLAQMNGESQEINATVQEIAAISEETTAAVEETTSTLTESSASMQNIAVSTEQLTQLAEQLNRIVKQYKVHRS